MKKILTSLALIFTISTAGAAQVYSGGIFRSRSAPTQVPGPVHLEDFVFDGKLRLGLEDAVVLALLNNTDISVNRAGYDLSQFAVIKAHQPFDPLLISSFSPTRSVSPSASSLSGASTLSTLNQTSGISFSQAFQTGAAVGIGFNTIRSTTNSSFATVNPSFTSGLTFSLSQPLWRNRGLFPNRAGIIIAKRGVRQSRATFEAQTSDSVQRVIFQYWDVVQAHKTLDVLKKSLDLAQASYDRDKRSLELGALPPLDIYRSESQVAQRKIAVIQSEYSLKQVETVLRQTVGADLDDRIGVLDLELTEKAEPSGTLASVDLSETLSQALKNRRELEAQNQQLAIDDANVKLANNNLKPDLNLSASYTSNGLGGVVFGADALGNPIVLSNGGFSDSLSQLGGFSFPTYGMSLQLRLPIRNSSAQADLGTALVSKRRSLYQKRSLEQTITTEVQNAVHDLEQAELVITAAQTSRDLSAQNLSAEERKYQLGAETIFFVLDAQNQLSQAELTLVQAQISYQRALAEVDHATGTLLDKHKVSLATSVP
ncbi:MAG TPA: TolC family protein [Candidatus Angelobacter sp.]